MQIHKKAFPDKTVALGLHCVPGHARTIGEDGNGDLAVWYETDDDADVLFQVLWTGQELCDGYTLVDTYTADSGLVWHLATVTP